MIGARRIVEDVSTRPDQLEDKERLAMALVVTLDDVNALGTFVDWLERRNANARSRRGRIDDRILGRIEGEEAVASALRSFIAGRRDWGRP